MPRPPKLNKDEITKSMEQIPQWSVEDLGISKEFVLPNFAVAIGFVNTIAVLAEKLDHHPDILIHGWNKVKISLFTHDVSGLTELDFKLAKQIDSCQF